MQDTQDTDSRYVVLIDGREVDAEPTLRRIHVADECDKVALVLDAMAAGIGRVSGSSEPIDDAEAQGWFCGLSALAERVRGISAAVMRLRDPEEMPDALAAE